MELLCFLFKEGGIKVERITESNKQALISSAHELYSLLPTHLIEIYENNLTEMKMPLYSNIGDWLCNNGFSTQLELSLENIILYLLDCIVGSSEQASLALYKKQKRNKKDYLMRSVEKELKDPSKKNRFIVAEWDLLNKPQLKMSAPLNYSEFEEFKKDRYMQILEWYKDPSSFLSDFLYFSVLAPKRKMLCFLDDLGVTIFTIICTEFYRSRFGYLTKSPDVTFGVQGDPILNWQSSTMNLSYDSDGSKITVYELLGNDDSMNKHCLIIDEIKCDCSTPEKEKAAIERINEEYASGVRMRTLDAADFSILTAILNNMTLESATSEPLVISFRELYNDIFSKYERRRKYPDFLYRLFKLGKIKISSYIQDAQTGNNIGGDIISFYDMTYEIPTSQAPKPTLTKTILSDRIMPDVSSFSFEEMDTMILTLSLSNFMKEQWQTGLHSYVSSHLYKQINTQHGKLLFQILQGERVRIYPETKIQLTMEYFSRKFRFSVSNTNRLKKDIISEIEQLKQMNAAVADYSVFRTYIEITFIPLSDFEKIKYKVNVSPAGISNSSGDELVLTNVEQQVLHFD